MSIKPFYVYKPSRDEAIEIVERIIANGGVCFDAVIGMDVVPANQRYEHDLYDSWGYLPNDGSYTCNGLGGENRLTMQQVRAMLPCEKYDGKEWNGEGLPPVGVVCEGLLQVEAGHPKWVKVEVLKIVKGRCAVYRDDYDVLKWCDEFRPLPTARDKFINDALAIAENVDAGLHVILGLIYDKMIAGDTE